MQHLARLLRLLTVAVLAAGLGLPALAHDRAAQRDAAHVMSGHGAHHLAMAPAAAAKTGSMDETCRKDCLGVSVLMTTASQMPAMGRVGVVHVAMFDTLHPSYLPAPEGPPPRA